MLKIFKHWKIIVLIIASLGLFILLWINNNITLALTVLAIIIIISFLVHLINKAYIEPKVNEITKLKESLEIAENKIKDLSSENEELKNRKVNIANIKAILELNLLSINTYFHRVFIDEFKNSKNEKIRFHGVLKVEMEAKYGIDLTKVRVKQNDKNNEILIAYADPKFLSFGNRNETWVIADIMKYSKRKLNLLGGYWRTSHDLELDARNKMEEYRKKTVKETENGLEELNWISGPLRKHVEELFTFFFMNSNKKIRFVDKDDETFEFLDSFNEPVQRS